MLAASPVSLLPLLSGEREKKKKKKKKHFLDALIASEHEYVLNDFDVNFC